MPDALSDFDALWDYNHPEDTERGFRALLPLAESSGNMSYQAELLTQIARTEGLQGKFEDAHRTLDTAQALIPGGTDRVRVRYLLERGRVLNSSGQPGDSVPLFLQAWQLGQEAGETALAIDAAHMLGIAAPPAERLEWNLKALQLAEDPTADERSSNWRGSLYNNIGWNYYDLGDYDTAIEMFNKASDAWQAAGRQDDARSARWSVAHTLRSKGEIEQALQAQRSLEAEFEKDGLAPSKYVIEEIAECLQALGEEEQAQTYRDRLNLSSL